MEIQLKVAVPMTSATQHVPRIFLDVSRLLTAGRRSTPSGIERVELAYVQRFSGSNGTRLVAAFLGRLHVLPRRFALSYVESLVETWSGPTNAGRAALLTKMVLMYMVLLWISLVALIVRPTGFEIPSVYLNLSHENLTAWNAILAFKLRMRAKLFCFVHDLIPITYPEYVRPGQAAMHCRRMDTVAGLADVVVVNSVATRMAFQRYAANKPQVPEVHVVPLGVSPVDPPRSGVALGDVTRPYFVILATVEPRKNHLLLLNIWRNLAKERATPPRLIIAGRLGWENEMVLDMLERCEAIAGIVALRQDVGDEALGPLLRGAQALLLPSFAEGFGLPVVEALAVGTPVICSDLPALREIGGDVPEYIDPMDGPAWRMAIWDYAQVNSPRRRAQCERLGSWSAPSWEAHFERVSTILAELTFAADAGR